MEKGDAEEEIFVRMIALSSFIIFSASAKFVLAALRFKFSCLVERRLLKGSAIQTRLRETHNNQRISLLKNSLRLQG